MKDIHSGCCDESLLAVEGEILEAGIDMMDVAGELPDESLELSLLEDDLLLSEEVESISLGSTLSDEEIESAILEGELPLDGELEIPVLETGGEIDIDSLISTLKKYPGLKITFSL